MAYDKAVDSGVLDAGLKLIADAIREKGGTEDTLAFPQAMADAIAAISTKGKVSYGTWSANYTGNVTITHDLGKVPAGVCAICVAESTNSLLSFLYTNSTGVFFSVTGAVYSYVTEEGGIQRISKKTTGNNLYFEANASIAILKPLADYGDFSGQWVWFALIR